MEAGIEVSLYMNYHSQMMISLLNHMLLHKILPLIIGEWSKIKMEDGFKQFLVLTLPELMLEDGISKSQMAEITQSPNSWASVLSNAVAQCFILYPVKK